MIVQKESHLRSYQNKMDEIKITGMVLATKPPMIKLDKLGEKKELDIKILEYRGEKFSCTSPKVLRYVYIRICLFIIAVGGV